MGKSNWAKSEPLESIFIGGGTPTVLSARQLSAVIEEMKNAFTLTHNCEITVESRFEGVDRNYLWQLTQAGVNRISFGVQSFNTEVRRRVGRIRDYKEICTGINEAAESGINIVCIDLIYNLPGQTPEIWKSDLLTVQNLPISGVSTYALIPFPKSALMSAIERGDEPPLGGIDKEYEMFCMADEILGDQVGWKRFGSRHVGKIGVETSRYNASRGTPMDIMALGSGAGGRIGHVGYMGSPQIEKYIEDQKSNSDEHTFATLYDPRLDQLMRLFSLPENLMLDDPALLSELPDIIPVFEKLQCLGLVSENNNAWKLTQSGRFWSYNIGAMISEIIRNILKIESM
jgi:oxygen-independent coproporphyrinogen-3 oxidase